MKIRNRFAAVCFSLALFISLGAQAKTKEPEESKEPKIEVPEEELKKDEVDEEGLHRLANFGKFHIFGYGEAHYNGRIGPSENEIDFHRLVLGLGYDFTDRIKFRSEVDFEHAFKEPELEFAYIDFLFRPWLNFRAGSLLLPLGIYNQHHEPPTFYSVERPEFYRVLIPTSWQEGGAGIHGKFLEGFDYELYAVSMLSAVTLNGSGGIQRSFDGSTGFRGGRGGVGEQIARDWGGAGRLEYKGISGLRLGTSFLVGNTGQGNAAIDGGFMSLIEADAKYAFHGFELEGAFGWSHLTDAGNINNVLLTADPNFTDFVASEMLAFYVEGAYHVLHHVLPNTRHDVVVFGRFEDFDTQFKMPAGFPKNPANDRNTVTVGVSYLPIPQVALKADYMFNWNRANAGVDQFNLGVGFYY